MNVTELETDIVGTKNHPKPWMVPTPVKLLPNLEDRQNFTHFESLQRLSFFVGIMGGGVLAIGLILELVVRITNTVFRRKENGYKVIGDNWTPVRETGHILERKGSYSIVDIWFTMYMALYQTLCAALVLISLRYDYMDAETGMNFELYIPWVLEALIVHVFSVIACVVTRIRNHRTRDIPSAFVQICLSVAPFLSERFNLIRDWVTIGIYLHDPHSMASVAAAIVFLSIVACNILLFNDPKLLLSMRLNYWLVAKQAMMSSEAFVYEFKPKTHKAYLDLVEQLSVERQIRPWKGKLAQYQLKLLCEMDTATQQHKVVNTLYGEIPQGVASLIFVYFSGFKPFVAVCLAIYISKVFLLVFVRPYVLCLLADANLGGWTHVKASDMFGILHSRQRYSSFCSWENRVLNALLLVKDMKEGPDEVAAALIGIGNLLSEQDDDESAGLVVSYTTFLRELHIELHEEAEGVWTVKKAIAQTMMNLCPGIDERDVSAGVPSPGNLGYLPTGGSLKEVQTIVNAMHRGEHDVLKLLEHRNVKKFAMLPGKHNGGKLDDLMVVYTDCEADDVIAIAQLWQWKIEKKKMAFEPVVMFGADFADKEHGTVFEKKHLLARLILGLRRFYILTPSETYYKEKQKVEHPSAEYWAERRTQELQSVCSKIGKFKGRYIHFYIMAPGKGNIASLLKRLKANGAWPAKQQWKISIYSGSFNIRGMTADDISAIKELSSVSDEPLLDAAKFPFFGGKNYHPWTSSFTTFAPENFSGELNMVAHPFVTACLKLLNDEHNLGLVAPGKLYKSKKLTTREEMRLEKLKPLHNLTNVSKFCKAVQEDFALFSKVEDFKKSILTSFAFECCDSPLADQLIFILELLADRYPSYLKNSDVVGAWVVNEKGFTSVDATQDLQPSSCRAIQPILSEPMNEARLTDLRDNLQIYLLKHLRCLHESDS